MPSDCDVMRWSKALSASAETWETSRLKDATDLEDAFSRNLSFGTGGIRGVMGIGPNRVNCLTIGCAAQGLASYLVERSTQPRAVIAYDTRIHSREFAQATAGVLAANGVHALIFPEPTATPILSFATRELGCDAGVVITASHNPKEYNGFKVYGPTGDQATDDLAHAVQRQIAKVDPFRGVSTLRFEEAVAAGLVEWVPDCTLDRYLDAVAGQSTGVNCSKVSLVYSPLNGTGLRPALALAHRLHVDMSLVAAQASPDGSFPTCPKPNPEVPSAMRLGMDQLLDEGDDVFVASDPDADRVGVACAHNGKVRLLTGDEVGLLLLDYLVSKAGASAGRSVAVTTIVTSPLADAICKGAGVELRRTLTGFKYIGEQIDLLEKEGRGGDFLLGFEESCGYLRGTYVRDKDSMVALMLVCEMVAELKSRGLDLVDALQGLYERYGYCLGRQVSVTLPGKSGRAAMERIMGHIRTNAPERIAGMEVRGTVDYARGVRMPTTRDGGVDVLPTLPISDVVEFRLGGMSKMIVRPSGTEPRVKCYLFADGPSLGASEEKLTALEHDVTEMIRLEVGGTQ